MSTQYISWPFKNLPIFPTFSQLPVPYLDGGMAITLDTYNVYIFDSNTQTWLAIGGTSVPLAMGPLDGQTHNANGAAIANNMLYMQSANASFPGVLLAADWTTFNNKQPAGNYITALTGDVTASGPGSVTATLVTVNSNVGSFGDASHSPSFTVNGKGLVTAASSNGILIAESQVTNLVSDLAGKQSVGNYITALTGDATASGPGSAALTLATVNGNVGSFGTASSVSSFTVNGKGLITAASNTSIQIAESQVTNLVSDLAGKQAGPLTGDVTTSGAAATLATVNGNVGTFGDATHVGQFTVNAKGLITAASNVVITGGGSSTTPTVQKFTSGSGTYTTPASVKWLRVRIAGGGGGGGASGAGSSGSNGNNSTFGSSLLTANGGSGGPVGANYGGAGGSFTVSAPGVDSGSFSGGDGGASGNVGPNTYWGGNGGANTFGGSGSGSSGNGNTGNAGKTNTGAGGGGGGVIGSAVTASGGGAGGYVEALISSPSATYSYGVGSGGGGGTGGSSNGGAGASGIIIVEEYY